MANPEATSKAEAKRERERTLYFNEETRRRFADVAGYMFFVDRVDPVGNPFKEAVVIPDDIRDAAYLGLDKLIAAAEEAKKQEGDQ